MANSIPFNDTLETAAIPKRWEVQNSVFGYSTCKFTVINYRDKRTHEVEVRVTKVCRVRYSDTLSFSEDLRLEGVIVKIDGKDWGPPADDFEANYAEDNPHACNFKIISHASDPLPTF